MGVIAAVTGAVIPAAAFAILTLIGARNAEIRQRVHALDRLQIDAAAETAVAAVGAAEGHEFFPTETHAAAAAVAGLHLELGFVDEFHAGCTKNKGARLPCPLRFYGALGARENSLLSNDVDVGVLLDAL